MHFSQTSFWHNTTLWHKTAQNKSSSVNHFIAQTMSFITKMHDHAETHDKTSIIVLMSIVSIEMHNSSALVLRNNSRWLQHCFAIRQLRAVCYATGIIILQVIRSKTLADAVESITLPAAALERRVPIGYKGEPMIPFWTDWGHIAS